MVICIWFPDGFYYCDLYMIGKSIKRGRTGVVGSWHMARHPVLTSMQRICISMGVWVLKTLPKAIKRKPRYVQTRSNADFFHKNTNAGSVRINPSAFVILHGVLRNIPNYRYSQGLGLPPIRMPACSSSPPSPSPGPSVSPPLSARGTSWIVLNTLGAEP